MKISPIIFTILCINVVSVNAMLTRACSRISKVPMSGIIFDREKMDNWNGWKVEGYWASSEDPDKDLYQGKYPFPKSNKEPFERQDEFLKKLKEIESLAIELHEVDDKKHPKIIIVGYRGLAFSRFEKDVLISSREFEDYDEKIMWPEGFASYYVEKFNVKPSAEFFEYVMSKE